MRQPKAGVEEQPETKGNLQGGANTGSAATEFHAAVVQSRPPPVFRNGSKKPGVVGIDEAGGHHAGERVPSGAFATLKTSSISAPRAIGPTTG
jgi:hypothetical protein